MSAKAPSIVCLSLISMTLSPGAMNALVIFPTYLYVDDRVHVDVTSSLQALKSCRVISEEERAMQYIEVCITETA